MNRTILCCLAVASVAALTFAGPEDSPTTPTNEGQPGRFVIDKDSWETPILLDTATGDTWTLHESTNLVDARKIAWMPMTRLSNASDVDDWKREAEAAQRRYLASLKSQSLAALEAKKKELGENHPEVIRLEKEIDQFKFWESAAPIESAESDAYEAETP